MPIAGPLPARGGSCAALFPVPASVVNTTGTLRGNGKGEKWAEWTSVDGLIAPDRILTALVISRSGPDVR